MFYPHHQHALRLDGFTFDHMIPLTARNATVFRGHGVGMLEHRSTNGKIPRPRGRESPKGMIPISRAIHRLITEWEHFSVDLK